MDSTCDPLSALTAFPDWLYSCFGKRSNDRLELTDAILTARPQPSPVHLRLEASPRRSWGSLYAALSHAAIDIPVLRQLLNRYPLATKPPTFTQ